MLLQVFQTLQTFNSTFSVLHRDPCVRAQWLGHDRLLATPWTVVHQPPLSMGVFRHKYWNELSFPYPGNSDTLTC